MRADHDEAMLYGGLVGLKELAVEYAVGGISGTGTGYLDDFLPKGPVANYVMGVLSEGNRHEVLCRMKRHSVQLLTHCYKK